MAIPYAQDAAASQYFASKNPGAALKETKTGNLVATNPSTGKSNSTPISDAYTASLINNWKNQSASLEQQSLALQREIAALENTPAPALNINAIRASAQKAANAAVNPYYNQLLNNYLKNESAQKATAQSQNQLSIQAAQSALQHTQAQNAQQQQFTGQNTALNVGNINTQEANRQQNEGEQFDQQRAQLEQKIGQGGLGASGIGQQQVWHARNLMNIQESQAQDQSAYQRNQQLLNESNTFAQLAESNKYAGTQEGQSEKKANLDLQSFLQQQAASEQQFRAQNEQSRQQAIQEQTKLSTAMQVAKFIQSFQGNPAVFNAAMKAYGGLENV